MKNPVGSGSSHASACARVAARFRTGWLRLYVASKLRSDPAYPAAYELLRDSGEPLLDIGCGLGLLAFYLRERDFRAPVTGLDSDPRKIARAREITENNYEALDFQVQDIREATIRFSGNVALLDLVHYLNPVAQETLLRRLQNQIAPGGLLLLRDCPRDYNARFWMTYLAERFAQGVSWIASPQLHFPSRESINSCFGNSEFSCECRPLWGTTPFNNHLFIFRRNRPAVVPAVE